MALTKVTGKGITCSAVTEDKLGTSAVTTNKIGPDAVTSAKIQNGQVTADDLASTLDLSSKTVTLPSDVVADAKRPVQDNIALLGFKMAVNDGLTVFNLVDGVVDEFNDESGTDESEGSNDVYCASGDFYQNVTVLSGCVAAGFSTTAITEPDTSTAGTNPAHGLGTFGTFTVPCGATSLTVQAWGAGGGMGSPINPSGFGGSVGGGGGGYSDGTLAVTPGQTLTVVVGEGGNLGGPGQIGTAELTSRSLGRGGAQNISGLTPEPASTGGGGGGLTGLFVNCLSFPSATAPDAYLVAGSGGGGAHGGGGGAGGGTTGCAGGSTTEQTNRFPHPNGCFHGGGGDQEQGGQGGASPPFGRNGSPGGLFLGGSANTGATAVCATTAGGGGGGYYGGGGGSSGSRESAGGGGSSYTGNPSLTSGSTEEGGSPTTFNGGGTGKPGYVPGTNEAPNSTDSIGEDGYVLITGSYCSSTPGASTTIVSTAFTSNSVATSARIVVFEENVDTPTLNTDIIASVSRDGTNFTNATLTDSGYVTGSSGQRILTGQADISGQPSGQSMRWKLALANNTVKIHGVALQWS